MLHLIRDNEDFIPELDFVMELNGELIGQTVFVKAKIDVDGGGEFPILTMGPICIAPEFKRQGYGKMLLDYSLEKAKAFGNAVLFEGNIAFYGKSGFTEASQFGIRYHGIPEGEDASFFLCKELKSGYLEGVTGVYSTPSVYFVDDSDVEEFDKDFPEKQKLRLPTQIF